MHPMPSGLHRQRYRLIIATFEFRTEDLLSIDTHQYRIVLGRNSQSEPEEEKHPKQSNHKHHPFFLYGCKYKQNARKAAISLRHSLLFCYYLTLDGYSSVASLVIDTSCGWLSSTPALVMRVNLASCSFSILLHRNSPYRHADRQPTDK